MSGSISPYACACVDPAIPKVRKEVERTVAKLAAWSISLSSKGIGPQVGFAGEEFQPHSTRFKMRGQNLANGWKKPDVILFIFHHGKTTIKLDIKKCLVPKMRSLGNVSMCYLWVQFHQIM